jgi:hypothetical protein
MKAMWLVGPPGIVVPAAFLARCAVRMRLAADLIAQRRSTSYSKRRGSSFRCERRITTGDVLRADDG